MSAPSSSAPQFCSYCYRESIMRAAQKMPDPAMRKALIAAAERHMRRDAFPSQAAHKGHAGARARMTLDEAMTEAREATA